jgi:hypothetical protein
MSGAPASTISRPTRLLRLGTTPTAMGRASSLATTCWAPFDESQFTSVVASGLWLDFALTV